MFCAKCGTETPDGFAFCPNCGTAVANRNVAQNAQNPMQNPAGNAVQNTADAVVNQGYTDNVNYGQQAINTMPDDSMSVQNYAQQAPEYVNNAQNYTQQASGYVNPAQNYSQQPSGYEAPQQAFNAAPSYQQGGYQYNPQSGDYMTPPKKKKTGLIIAIASAAVVALVAVLLFVWPGFLRNSSVGNSPEATVKAFAAALEKFDFDAMADCFDPDTRQDVKKAFDSVQSMMGGSMGGLDVNSIIDMMNLKVEADIIDVDYNSDNTACKAKVELTMSFSLFGYSDSTNETVPMDLVKIGGKWYINGNGINMSNFFKDLF